MEPTLRQVTVAGHSVRVAVRPAGGTTSGTGTPLLLCNGIGASLDLLQPFVDALDPSIEVVSFDVPGVGGSPDPSCRTTSRCSPGSSGG
jgi:pimeloyl-ACP methyl ester carboxylesterase